MKRKTTTNQLAKQLNISKSRAFEARVKAKMISAIIKAIKQKKMTHAEVAKKSGLPRSAVTGILSGSLQKVTIDRILRLLEALDLIVDVRIKDAA